MNRNVCLRLDIDDVQVFHRQHPYMMSQFLRQAIKKAISDIDFFEYTMFEDVNSKFSFYKESKNV